jgi:hypothetical protein
MVFGNSLIDNLKIHRVTLNFLTKATECTSLSESNLGLLETCLFLNFDSYLIGIDIIKR